MDPLWGPFLPEGFEEGRWDVFRVGMSLSGSSEEEC